MNGESGGGSNSVGGKDSFDGLGIDIYGAASLDGVYYFKNQQLE